MRVVVHQVMEVLREQRRELAHVRELFALVCGRVHTWWCCARPCRRRSQRGEAEEAWALRRRRSTSDDGFELSGPLRHGHEEEEKAYKAGNALILSRLASSSLRT